MPHEGGRPEELTYDFERDVWVEERFIQTSCSEGNLPAPKADPAPGRWFRDESSVSLRPSLVTRLRRLDPFFHVIGAMGLFSLTWIYFANELVLSFILALTTLLAFVFRDKDKGRRGSEHDLRLLEKPYDPDLCLVEIEIFRDGQSYGKDRGVVWFEGGRLLFSGHRTSFAIGGEDVLPRSFWPGETNGSLDELELPLRVKWHSVRLSFRILSYGASGSLHESRFRDRFRVFRSRPPKSRGSRQWPPF